MATRLVVSIYCSILVVCCIVEFSVGQRESKQLLRYDEESNKLQLDASGLSELSHLQAPVTILGAIGDARVGKSTTLNHIQHIWRGQDGTSKISSVFNTSNQMEPCTRGVWVSVTGGTEGGSTVLLDVEGSNLGDDTKTNQFSIFTALLSSALMLFGEGTLTNHNRDFLFRLTRVTEEIWRDELRDAAVSHFPGLRVILKQPLNPPHGVTLADHVVRSLVGTHDDKARVLKIYFPESKIDVSAIPTVSQLKRSNGENNGLMNDQYKHSVMKLVNDLKPSPAKTTPSGALMNGQMIADLATKLVEAMNKNSWLLLADTFTAMEKSFCDKAFTSLIKPMNSNNHHTISARKTDVLSQFDQQCVLNAERSRTKRWLEDVIRDKQNAEEKQRMLELQRKQREEEERKQRELQEQRRREEELQRRRMEEERQRKAAEERRRREQEERAHRAEQERQRQRQVLEESQRAEERARRSNNDDDIVKVAAAIFVPLLIFSDERLKQNITTVPGSQYEVIGLRGVTWTWNQKAQAMGMHGTAEGVVAQEVEALYPQAVTAGDDGYKRVNYALLQSILVSGTKIDTTACKLLSFD